MLTSVSCTKCKNNLTADRFYKDSRSNRGVSSWCKACLREHRSQPAVRKRISANSSKRYHNNQAYRERAIAQATRRIERLREEKPGFREAQLEYQRGYHKDQKANNPAYTEKRKAKQREASKTADRKEKAAAQSRRFRKAHPEKGRALSRRWVQANPEAARAMKIRRRARKANAPGDICALDIKAVFERDGDQCLACGATEHLSIDHIVPLVKGGTNLRDNLQTLCRSCNSVKHDKTIDYRKHLGSRYRGVA